MSTSTGNKVPIDPLGADPGGDATPETKRKDTVHDRPPTHPKIDSKEKSQRNLQFELRKFQVLYELASALTADHSLDENLQLIVERTRELLSADTSYIALRDSVHDDIYIRTCSGIRTEAFRKIRIPVGKGLGGLVASTRQGLIVDDYFQDTRLTRAVDSTVAAEGLLSGMAVPIQMGEENLGVLYIFNRNRTTFNQDDLETLQLIGNLAAVAVSHDRVVRSLQDASRQLESRVAERTARLTSEIEQRKKTEEAFRESEQHLRALFEHSMDGILTSDPQRRVTDCNPAFLKMFGFSRQEVIGKSLAIIYNHTEDFERFGRIVYPAVAKDGFWRGEWVHYRKDGTSIPTEATISPLRKPGGGTYGYVSIIREVSERKKSEAALRQSEEKYRDLFNSISDFIYTHDLEGRFLSVNPAIVKALGYREDELVGSPVNKFMLPKYKDDFINSYLPEVIKRGHKRGISVYVAKDGKELYTEYRSVVVEQDGKPAYVSGSGREVTERVLAGREMRRLQSQLQQAQKMEAIGTLAGGVAHGFNNILQAMEGYVELLSASNSLNPTDREYLSQIYRAVHRAGILVKQLLAFSRKVEPELVKLDLNQVVLQSLRLLKHAIPKMIEIKTHLAPNLPKIWGDPNQLEQVLINLVTNARDAMPHGGTLVVQTSQVTLRRDYSDDRLGIKAGPHVLLQVSDSGAGMEEEEIEHIFDPFYTTKEVGRGTGLGLSTVFGIVRAHGGYINCISEKGRGTTFKIYLPQDRQPEEAVAAPPDSQEPSTPDVVASGQETILVVDDEKPIVEMSKQILEQFGYQVITADCCETALELYQELGSTIDLVVLDLGMPGLGGHVCLQRLTEMDPEVKIIVASGYTADGQIKDTLKAGAKDFLTKPFSLKTLVQKVHDTLKG